MPGDGKIESMFVKVILKDSDGKVIETRNSNINCIIFYDSIEVTWNLKMNKFGMEKLRVLT